MKRYSAHGYAGCVEIRKDSLTGAKRAIYIAAEQGIDDTDGKYAVVCEDHGTILSVRTLARAKTVTTLDFCDDCRVAKGMGI